LVGVEARAAILVRPGESPHVVGDVVATGCETYTPHASREVTTVSAGGGDQLPAGGGGMYRQRSVVAVRAQQMYRSIANGERECSKLHFSCTSNILHLLCVCAPAATSPSSIKTADGVRTKTSGRVAAGCSAGPKLWTSSHICILCIESGWHAWGILGPRD
jgi:hypothetical protein